MASGRNSSGMVGAGIACSACLVMYFLCRFAGMDLIGNLFLGAAAIAVIAAAVQLFNHFLMIFEVRRMMKPTHLYGSGIIAGEKNCREFGLTNPLNGSRIFLGGLGESILTYDGVSHLLTVAPNAAGKTASLAITNNLALTHNTISTDKGGEVAMRCFHYRRDILGHKVIAIDPWGLGKDQNIPNHEFNPAGGLVSMAARGDPGLIDECKSQLRVLIPERKGENSFFSEAAKSLSENIMFYLAYWEADTGELVCNYPYLFKLFSGSQERLIDTLEKMARADYCEGEVAETAMNILKLMEENKKTFVSIRQEAINALSIFDSRGILAKSCELSSFDPAELKRCKMSVFVMAPPEMLNGPYGVWAGLVMNTLINVCLRARTMHYRSTFILDEFANLSPGPLPSILPALYVGRSYGTQIWVFVQDKSSLKRYGDEHTAFESQSEIVNCWGTRTVDDAKWIEDKSAQYSAVTEGPNLPVADEAAAGDGRFSIGLSEKGVPVIRKDQAMQLPDYTQIIFYKNKPVIVADLVSYRAVTPWKDQVTVLPGDENEPDLSVRFDLREDQPRRREAAKRQ